MVVAHQEIPETCDIHPAKPCKFRHCVLDSTSIFLREFLAAPNVSVGSQIAHSIGDLPEMELGRWVEDTALIGANFNLSLPPPSRSIDQLTTPRLLDSLTL